MRRSTVPNSPPKAKQKMNKAGKWLLGMLVSATLTPSTKAAKPMAVLSTVMYFSVMPRLASAPTALPTKTASTLISIAIIDVVDLIFWPIDQV